MNGVELVREICKKRGISVAKLERECGFSNGYISKLKRGVFPIEKAEIISAYLGIDVAPLVGVQTDVQQKPYYINEETARIAQELFDDPNLRVLFDAARDSRPEDIKMAADMLKRFKETNPDA